MTATAQLATPAIADVTATTTPTDAILREITRGGLAGLAVGIVVAGIGGRLVMRLAALLVPDATGAVTENGNIIGTITLGGTFALVTAIGLFFGAVGGSLWVTMRPWLPASAAGRALVAMPIAIALGTASLVDDRNPDFDILHHDPLVVASLVLLVALFGPALVLVEGWLEGRLPHPKPSDKGVIAGYAIVTVIGLLLTVFLIVPLFLGSAFVYVGLALIVVGVATLISWWLRVARGRGPGVRLTMVARAALAVATAIGLWIGWVEVSGALAIT